MKSKLQSTDFSVSNLKIPLKKMLFSNKEIIRMVSKPIKNRQVKNRNINLKDVSPKVIDTKGREATRKVYMFGKRHSSVQKIHHKRAGTTFGDGRSSISNIGGVNGNSQFMNKNYDQLKISRNLIKRLKRKSVNYSDGLFKSSLDKS
jgi:uncharacterized protein (DUF2252 family)